MKVRFRPEPHSSNMHLPPQHLIGRYRVVRLIGDGGMGSVYECRHETLGSRVALKFLHPDLARRPGLAERFLREARVSATIQSPHVARVMDVDQTTEGAPFLVMELLLGESLQTLIERTPKLEPRLALDLTRQILSGLEAAHALGVVHRDIKPDNVFITHTPEGPWIKLIDFGIAKLKVSAEFPQRLTRTGAVMGTPEYMAPEQLYAASEVDLRADIYSVGVMLYEMLCGHRPADGSDPQTIIMQVTTGQVRPLRDRAPELSADLAALVHQAMAPNREQRFASAGAMYKALDVLGRRPFAAVSIAGASPATGLQTPVMAPPRVVRTLPPEAPSPSPGNTEPERGPAYGSTEAVPIMPQGGSLSVRQSQLPLQPHAHGAPFPGMTGAVARTQPDRNSAKAWLWLIPAILLLAGGAVFAGIWFELLENPFAERVPPPLPALLPGATDRASDAPADTSPPLPATSPPPPADVRPPPGPPVGPKTSRPDAGTPEVKPDAGLGWPPISIPTTFPPIPGLPTALPTTLPTEFPPIPGLPTALPTTLPTELPPIPGLPTALPTTLPTELPPFPGLPPAPPKDGG